MATLGTFSAGQVLTAAELNDIGTWTTYTPTAKVGANNVTLTYAYGKYTVLNELAIAQVLLSGFSYSGSGNLVVEGLPAAAYIAAGPTGFTAPRVGFATLWNLGTSVGYEGSPYRSGSGSVGFTGTGIGVWTNTAPITLDANSQLYFTIVYEVA